MFTTLSQMITKANLSGVTLMVRPSGTGRLSVVICAESTDWKADDQELKAALTQPLVIEGEVVGLETQLLNDLSNHSGSFVRAALSSNAHTVSAAHDAATAKANKQKADATEPSSDPVDSDSSAPTEVGKEVTDQDLF